MLRSCALVLMVQFVIIGCLAANKAARNFDSSGCSTFPCKIFEDNFDTLDFATWQHEFTAGGGGNGEFQYYTNNRSNSYVHDGTLFIKPTLATDRWGTDWPYSGVIDLWGGTPADLCTSNQWSGCYKQAFGSTIVNPIQSARLRTANSFYFRYGRLEVEAKLPKGDWIWPAIWLLPRFQKYSGWPASGEIDLMESRGNLDYTDGEGNQVGVAQMASTLHYGPYWPENGYPYATNSKTLTNGRTFADDFHVFTLDWDETGLNFSVDGTLFHSVATGDGYWKRGRFDGRLPDENNPWRDANADAPFDQEFHLILNVAVGGTGGYFWDGLHNEGYPKPWSDSSNIAMREFWDNLDLWYPTWPQGEKEDDRAMQINYIRVWKMKEDCFLKGTCK